MKRSKTQWWAMAAVALVVGLPSLALGQPEPTVRTCPVGFHLHAVNEDHDHGAQAHRHVGTSEDQNGDGSICVKHVGLGGSVHVHIDNAVAKR